MLKEKWEKMGAWSPLAALEKASETKWLIDGVISSGSVNWMVASPESFKTFLALDMAACVAGGRSWHGRETDGAVVLYLAAEGGNDIHIRRAAADMAAGDTGPLCIVQMRPRVDEPLGLVTLASLVWRVTYAEYRQQLDFPEYQKFQDDMNGGVHLTEAELKHFKELEARYEETDDDAESCAGSDYSRSLSRTQLNAHDDAIAKVVMDLHLLPFGNSTPAKQAKNVFLIIDTYSQTSCDDTKPVVSRYIKTLRDLQEKAAALGGTVTVLVIDHTTKSGESYMGSLAKEGDSDTMMEVDRQGKGYGVTLKCSKMKMSAPFAPVHLELKPFELEGFTDALGRPLTSLVVSDGEQAHKVRKAAGAASDTAAAIVLGLVPESGTTEGELRQLFTTHKTNEGKKADSVSRSFRRAFDELTTIKAVFVDSAGVVLKATDTGNS